MRSLTRPRHGSKICSLAWKRKKKLGLAWFFAWLALRRTIWQEKMCHIYVQRIKMRINTEKISILERNYNSNNIKNVPKTEPSLNLAEVLQWFLMMYSIINRDYLKFSTIDKFLSTSSNVYISFFGGLYFSNRKKTLSLISSGNYQTLEALLWWLKISCKGFSLF